MSSSYTLRELIHYVEGRLSKAELYYGHGADNAHDEAAYLVLGGLQLGFDVGDETLSHSLATADVNHVEGLLDQRINERKPVAYLLKEAWFGGLPFYVDERVLIPRSPIAELIEQGFSPWVSEDIRHILDIGTGSGCIAIATALAFPEAQVDATDISTDALAVAKKNVGKHKVEEQVHLIQSDLYKNLDGRKYDLIIANPPYVSIAEVTGLPKEYKHEPVLGLEAGEDGMDIVRRLLTQSKRYLNAGGIMLVEVGQSQEAFIAAYPELAVTWLEFEYGGEGVFLLRAEDLSKI